MAKSNKATGLIIADVSSKDHVLVKVPGIEKTGWKSDFLDVCVDMMFALSESKIAQILSITSTLPSYILETKRPPEISAELGSELQIKHCTPASNEAFTRLLPWTSSLPGSFKIF
jgi:hypothetical protein